MNLVSDAAKHSLQSLGGFFLSGCLMGVGFLFHHWWVMVIPGIALFIFCLFQAKDWKLVVGGSFLAWSSKALFATSVFLTTYPIEWINLQLGATELPLIIFYWLSVSLVLGLAGSLLGSIVWLLQSRQSLLRILIITPWLWLVAEIFSAFFFSLFTLGEGGTLNVVFSFSNVGYLLAEQPWLLQLARLGGVYALTVVTAYVGVGMFWWLRSRQYQVKAWLVSFAVLAGLVIFIPFGQSGYPSSSEPKITVAVVDTTFGDNAYFGRSDGEEYHAAQLKEAVSAALATGADYVIMNEDSRYLSPGLSPKASYPLFRFAHGDPKSIVVEAGAAALGNTSVTLRATIYDGRAKTVYAVDKQYLVPQGEYMPYFYLSMLSLLEAQDALEALGKKLTFIPGPLASQAELPDYIPGVLFCFASADPLGVFNLVKERPMPFVAHPISYSWFHNQSWLVQQNDDILKVHAVWNQVPIVSAGNMVDGALYLPSGIKVLPKYVAQGERWRVGLVSW